MGNLNARRNLKIKKKDVYFKYISVFREKYRYKELRYLGCTLSDPQKWFDHTLGYIKSWGISDSAGGGGGTLVFFGWVCAARDPKLTPRSKKISAKIDTPF